MHDQLGDDGESKFVVAQIAAEFGISRPIVYRYLDRNLLPPLTPSDDLYQLNA